MTFKTFGISGFRIFAYKFFLAPTTSLKRTVIKRSKSRNSSENSEQSHPVPGVSGARNRYRLTFVEHFHQLPWRP